MKFLACCFLLFLVEQRLNAAETVAVWPDLAPGESTRSTGKAKPVNKDETPPVMRVVNITQPTFTVHLAPKPNGAAVVILPGGGFKKVVVDKEGVEAAEWLNRCGISAFVLHYRTASDRDDSGWKRALQDAQRTMALVRSRADGWGLKADRLGLLGFSAGGQVAARLICDRGELAYERLDGIDDLSHRPDFALLIYPWNLYDRQHAELIDGVEAFEGCPPTFLVHTDDDPSSSLGSVMFYAKLKQAGIPGELHVYGNGGHGYGLRAVTGSKISTWPHRAEEWLATRGLK